MAKEMQEVNESRLNPARAAAASPAAARILVVEDEAALSMLLSYNLEAEGFTVDLVERGDEAEIRLSETIPDLVILDWMLPGVSGLEICRRMRARETTRSLPVIMLTARGEESERVRGLAIGADDYVVKPFSVPELMARVHALLRRARSDHASGVLSAGDLDLDRQNWRVRRAGREVHIARQRLGTFGGNRRAHRRRSYRPFAQGVVEGDGKGSHPHRARRGLCVRRNLRQDGVRTQCFAPWMAKAF
jgi:two-component system phosphate regulon response regulator PhoB